MPSMIGRALSFLALLAGSGGCYEATGAVEGGEPRALADAGSEPADGGGDAAPRVPSPCDDAGNRGDGSTFTDLYRDFFGPGGLASCSASSSCHVPGGSGEANSGYVCSPDQKACWASMTSSIVPDGGSAAPETTLLYRVLRKAPPTPGSGPMPRSSTFAFCPPDLERIKAWIASGAANE